jgi:hypothetical protein
MRWPLITCIAALTGLASPGFGQAINIDFGDPAAGVPAITYGAAGMPGFWNGVTGVPGTPIDLLDLSGGMTGAKAQLTGGLGNFFFNNAATTGDDQLLMDDLQDVGGVGSVTTLDITGLTNGSYKVRVYAWAPDNRMNFTTDAWVMGGSVGPQTLGGAWTGSHVLGETYAEDTTNVTSGSMQITVTTSAGFGSLNGVQIEATTLFGSFCTAKTTSTCGAASISASGTPSVAAASGFVVGAGPTRGCRNGLLLYSNQAPAIGQPFGGPGDGVLCLVPMGLRRAGPIDAGGTSPAVCDGLMSIDINAFASSAWAAVGCMPPPGQNNPAAFLNNVGVTVSAQIWGRDSVATGQVLSDGIQWTVAP